jgi:hypothetical protein
MFDDDLLLFKNLPDVLKENLIAPYLDYDKHNAWYLFNQRFYKTQEFKEQEGLYCVKDWLYGLLETILFDLKVVNENGKYYSIKPYNLELCLNSMSFLSLRQEALNEPLRVSSVAEALSLLEIKLSDLLEKESHETKKYLAKYLYSKPQIKYYPGLLENSELKKLFTSSYNYNAKFSLLQATYFEERYPTLIKPLKQYAMLSSLHDRLPEDIKSLGVIITFPTCKDLTKDVKPIYYKCNLLTDLRWSYLGSELLSTLMVTLVK